MKKIINSYEQAVEYLLSIPRFTVKHSMDDTRAFLKELGSPDESMPIIHVAGTNGKGSVCAYMRYILEASGKKVCVFTSPHLVEIRERFLVEGKMITKKAFLDAFYVVYDKMSYDPETGEGYHPTFFEYLFFMAMLIFREAKPDYCILETGLGGRLDATNSVTEKKLTVITRIGLDHTEYLGDTLEEIAAEKAGIIRANVPVVAFDTNPEVRRVIWDTATKLGAPAYFVSKCDVTFGEIKNKTIDFSMGTRYYGYIGLSLNTFAGYQMENCALAVRAIEELDRGSTISLEQIQNGVRACFWQGRMEEVAPEVYVDGAHNSDGIRAFTETVKMDGFSGRRTLLLGIVKDKDYVLMIKEICESGLFDRICTVQLETPRSLSPQQLCTVMEKEEVQAIQYRSVYDALKELLSLQKPKERIYCAGSLYLVGQVKEYFEGL